MDGLSAKYPINATKLKPHVVGLFFFGTAGCRFERSKGVVLIQHNGAIRVVRNRYSEAGIGRSRSKLAWCGCRNAEARLEIRKRRRNNGTE